MQIHGFDPSEEEIRDMIRNVDKTNNGFIDFNEFLELMIGQGRNDADDTAQAFNVFDRDGDGLITAEELRLTMNNLGVPLTEKEVEAMVEEADSDGDGKIDFVEFKTLMANNTP